MLEVRIRAAWWERESLAEKKHEEALKMDMSFILIWVLNTQVKLNFISCRLQICVIYIYHASIRKLRSKISEMESYINLL